MRGPVTIMEVWKSSEEKGPLHVVQVIIERSDSNYRRMKGPLNIEEGHSEWGMTKMKRPVRK